MGSATEATVSLRICQEGHANALAMNKDYTQIAVAGRSLLKVYSIEHDGFIESCNLRGGKPQNLTYSSNDVTWCPTNTNIIATAATNGVISVWDLTKFGRHKQLLTYTEHERTAHTVTFHNTEQALLLSGSQDGTIKCFDLKSTNSVFTIFCNSEGVRDIKFSPLSYNTFVAVSENGTVQLYDIRKHDKSILQFTAHSGPIFCCDWHPVHNWLATGSRDKQIKIWNMENKTSLESTIPTIAAVGRVKWRPEKNHQIASCALLVDYSIHVWDIRRPYMPYASFNEHTNITTGIAWKGTNPQVLLSTSKDSTIFKHAFKDAVKSTSRANPQGTTVGASGDIFFSMKLKQVPQQSVKAIKVTQLLSRQKSTSNEHFHLAQSALYRLLLKPGATGYNSDKETSKYKESDSLICCAKEYIYRGRSLADICEHNKKVSRKYGRHSASTIWNFVQLFYASPEFVNRKPVPRSSFSSQHKNFNVRRLAPVETTEDLLMKNINKMDINGGHKDVDSRRGSRDYDSIARTYFQRVSNNHPVILENSETPCKDFKSLRDGFLYMGPHYVSTGVSFPETVLHHDFQAARQQEDMQLENDDTITPDVMSVLKIPSVPQIPNWEPHQSIANCLMLQADVGDVQTPLAVVIAMGLGRKELNIDQDTIEFWFHSYIELLHRYQLWNEAAFMMKISWFDSVNALNKQSTSVHISCGKCGRQILGSVGWLCSNCKSTDCSKCSICGLVVKGFYTWCQGCGHGGHVQHIKDYFSNNHKCPKCGHHCEYD